MERGDGEIVGGDSERAESSYLFNFPNADNLAIDFSLVDWN